MALVITSIVPAMRKSIADAALSAAVDRFLPNPEAHELQYIRDELRHHGFDVLPLIREVR
jgi:hypothetical protein